VYSLGTSQNFSYHPTKSSSDLSVSIHRFCLEMIHPVNVVFAFSISKSCPSRWTWSMDCSNLNNFLSLALFLSFISNPHIVDHTFLVLCNFTSFSTILASFHWHLSTLPFKTTSLFCCLLRKAQIPLCRLPRNFPVTRAMGKFRGSRQLVTGKLWTWILKQGSHGEVSGFQTIATCRHGLKKSHDKSATSPFVSF